MPRIWTLVVLGTSLTAVGCDEDNFGTPSVTPETRVLMTPKGIAEVAAKRTPLGWESGDQVFTELSFRDSLVAESRKWEGGVVPYYWPTSDAGTCGMDPNNWCAGERERAEAVIIAPDGQVSADGAVALAKQTYGSHTSVSLIDVTDINPRPPGALAISRRELQENGDQVVQCLLADNDSPAEKWLISFDDTAWFTDGIWELVLGLGLGESPINTPVDASEVSEVTFDVYADLVEQSSWCPGCMEPALLIGAVPGDITLERSVAGEGFQPIYLSTPSSEERVAIRPLVSACAGNGCSNPGCAETFVCNGVFLPDQAEYSETDGICQKENGVANVGASATGSTMWLGTHHLTKNIQGTIVHEFMHSVGFVHEQNRANAFEFLEIAKDECVEPGREDGDLNLMTQNSGIVFDGENAGFGPSPNESGAADFISSMMYSSGNACLNQEPGCDRQCLVAKSDELCPEGVCTDNPSGPGFQIRPPGWVRPAEDFDKPQGRGAVRTVARKSGMSESDMDAFRWYYPFGFSRSSEVGVLNAHPDCVQPGSGCEPSPLTAECFLNPLPLGTTCSPWIGDEDGDRFGGVLALGAFGDENNAIVVGVPDEGLDHPVTPTASGMVAVFEGRFWSEHRALRRIPTHSPSHTLSVADARRQNLGLVGPPLGGDRFGGAVATLDINNDGWGDIAVAAPGRNEVFVFTGGSAHGKQQELLGVISGVPGDDFGAALQSTRIDDRDVLLVGVPGAGRVELYSENAVISNSPDGELSSPMHGPSTRFGQAIAAIPNLGMGPDHIIVGAPESGNDAGALVIYRAASLGSDATPSSVLAGAPNDQLGAQLVSGDLTSEYDGLEIVAAAPLSQRVYVLYTSPNNLFQILNEQTVFDITDAGGDFDVTARFGASVAVADERSDGSGYVIVGAPGEDAQGVFDAGALYFVRFEDDGGLTVENGTRHTVADALPCLDTGSLPFDVECDIPLESSPSPSSGLGTVVVANKDIIVAGTPGESASGSASAGRIYVWVRGREDEPPAVGDPDYDTDQFFLMHWYSQSTDFPALEAYDQ